MIKNILWDFDGVFVNSVPLKGKGFHEVYKKFGELIATEVEAEHYKMGGISRYVKFRKWHKKFLNEEISDDQVQKLAQKYSNFVKSKVIEEDLTDGLSEFLNLSSRHYNNWIISGTPHNEMNEIVEKKELSKYFLSVHGSPKSKIQWVQHLLKNHQLNSDNTVFIGDANSDYMAAKEFNFKFIAVSREYNMEQFHDATLRINDFINFQQKIERL